MVRPERTREESLLLIALLRTLWRLSYQDMRDWLRSWPDLALACGLPLGKDGFPRVPCPSQQWKRGNRAGAPLCTSGSSTCSSSCVGGLMSKETPSHAILKGKSIILDYDML